MQLALFQPDIPQNLGAAIRLSACFRAPLHIIEPCGFALTDKALRRAAMDYAGLADVRRHDGWAGFHAAARASGHRLILLTTKGAQPLWTTPMLPGDIFVCGRESAGAPDNVHHAADMRAFIPLAPGARSLNVVTAAAIALGEASRRHGLAKPGDPEDLAPS